MNGILVLDKPRGMSSAAAVDAVKKRLGAARAGHGGTLDPLATGVLPICLGEATKLAQYLLADDKAYEADLVFGIETDTLDRTGTVTATRPVSVTREQFLAALAKRTGEQDQVPPMFSAIKQGGKRLYHHARAGVEVEREPRRIRIDALELLAFDPPHARIAIACSKGTYVRSLVADLGNDVGCGAHMTELRRTRSGVFTLAEAHDLDRLDNPRLVAMTEATRLPKVVAPADAVPKVRSGLQLPPDVFGAPKDVRFQLLDEAGSLVAVAHVEGHKVVYDRVFKP
jgi:tRNA pseudouridine55 synthase